jgi:flagellar motor switch protein FliN/FliY
MSEDDLMNLDSLGLTEDNFDDLFASDDDLGATDKPAAKPLKVTQEKKGFSFFHKLPVELTLEVASTEIMLGDLMSLCEGSVVQLDKLAGEPLDVKVNGTLIGKAEVVMVKGYYALRMTELSEDADLSQLA